MNEKGRFNDYDLEPVLYCSKCYSLRVVREDSADTDCCMDCGSTDIESTSIEEWEKMYAKRYGHTFLNMNGGARASKYFNMTVDELKRMLYRSDHLDAVIKMFYKKFPGGLTRTEKIILFFDQLGKDNRMEEFKMALYKLSRKRIVELNKSIKKNGRD